MVDDEELDEDDEEVPELEEQEGAVPWRRARVGARARAGRARVPRARGGGPGRGLEGPAIAPARPRPRRRGPAACEARGARVLTGGRRHAGEDGTGRGRQTRQEKKARKAVQKLGLKPVPNCMRVTIKKNKNILFVINKPDVFKASSDTFVIFGEAKIEDLSNAAQAQAAQQFSAAETAQAAEGDDDVPDLVEEEEGDVDESGLEEKDIELVMTQAGVARGKAVMALKKTDGDIVSAIMELTM